MFRTYQPKKLQRKKEHGFRSPTELLRVSRQTS